MKCTHSLCLRRSRCAENDDRLVLLWDWLRVCIPMHIFRQAERLTIPDSPPIMTGPTGGLVAWLVTLM